MNKTVPSSLLRQRLPFFEKALEGCDDFGVETVVSFGGEEVTFDGAEGIRGWVRGVRGVGGVESGGRMDERMDERME